MRRGRWIHLVLVLLLLSGCAMLKPVYETPQASVSSFRVLQTNTLVPEFEIGLHLTNPNLVPLKLLGLSYQVELEGHQVLSGVASELPEIPAYGAGDVVLLAKPDLFNTISLFSDLMKHPRETVQYRFTAQLDVGKLLPKIKVEKNGRIEIYGGNNK